MKKVIVFGYSDNAERYSNMAFQLLLDYHHQAIAFNPRIDQIESINYSFDTLTMYVNSELSTKWSSKLLKLDCKRVIFNPGTENAELQEKFSENGVEVVIGCTLVMLRTNQF